MKPLTPLLASFAGLLFTGLLTDMAHAQVPRGFTPQPAEARALEGNTGLSAGRQQAGLDALAAKNFEGAESIFEDILRAKRQDGDASFYAGVAEMSLGKWEEAKAHLEVAVKKKPKEPDPRSRLGVTLARLGDTAGAMEQRAALEKMAKDCKGSCQNAQFIATGIAMIDGALPKPATAP
jgi:tetratricopeptide (TPR) repeat protein